MQQEDMPPCSVYFKVLGRWASTLTTQDIKRQTGSTNWDVKRQTKKSENPGRWVSVQFVRHEGFGRFRFQMAFWNDKFLRFQLKENLILGC